MNVFHSVHSDIFTLLFVCCHTFWTGPSPFLDVCHMTANCYVTKSTDEDRWFWSKRLVCFSLGLLNYSRKGLALENILLLSVYHVFIACDDAFQTCRSFLYGWKTMICWWQSFTRTQKVTWWPPLASISLQKHVSNTFVIAEIKPQINLACHSLFFVRCNKFSITIF